MLAHGGRGAPRRVSGPASVRESALSRVFHVPAEAFWQVHPAAADTLANTVVELLDPRPGERAWDLYGGVGLFAAAVADRVGPTGRVTVVESHPAAAAAARRGLADLPAVRAVRADVRRWLDTHDGIADLVVLDPPRAGADHHVLRAVAARTRRAVAYVACDPAAFARDVARFRVLGWRLVGVHAFDLFPMTHHVETVGLFVRAADGETSPGRAGSLMATGQ